MTELRVAVYYSYTLKNAGVF